MHSKRPLLILLVVLLALAGCAQTEETSPAIPTLEPTLAAPPPTTPADMPTAAPLWTPTPPPQPVATLKEQTPYPEQGVEPAIDEELHEIDTPALDVRFVASVNGVTILRADYDKELAQAQAYLLQQPGLNAQSQEGQAALAELEGKQLQWMIDQEIIAQAANSLGLAISPDQLESQIEQMRGKDDQRFEQWLAANGLTIESLREQLAREMVTAAVRDMVTRALSREVPQVRLRHILLSDQTQAETVKNGISDDRSFVAAVFQHSEDNSTRDTGGDLGFMPRGVMPPAFDSVAFALERGEVSDVVQSDFGFHIIQLIEKDPARAVPDALWPAVQQQAFSDWLVEQRAQAEIIINK